MTITGMTVFWAIFAAVAIVLLHRSLVRNGWRGRNAVLFVAGLALNPLVILSPLLGWAPALLAAAMAVLVVSIRRLESIGDVQAQMSFGIFLGVCLALTPFAIVLIPLLVFLAPALSRDALRDWRAFVALLLVAALPAAIVAFGLYEFGVSFKVHLKDVVAALSGAAPDLKDLSFTEIRPLGSPILILGTWLLGPVILLFVWSDGRRYVASAAAALAIPVVIMIASPGFDWPVNAMVPAVVTLATTTAWFAGGRIPERAHLAALIGLTCCTLLGWAILSASARPASVIRLHLASEEDTSFRG